MVLEITIMIGPARKFNEAMVKREILKLPTRMATMTRRTVLRTKIIVRPTRRLLLRKLSAVISSFHVRDFFVAGTETVEIFFTLSFFSPLFVASFSFSFFSFLPSSFMARGLRASSDGLSVLGRSAYGRR